MGNHNQFDYSEPLNTTQGISSQTISMQRTDSDATTLSASTNLTDDSGYYSFISTGSGCPDGAYLDAVDYTHDNHDGSHFGMMPDTEDCGSYQYEYYDGQEYTQQQQQRQQDQYYTPRHLGEPFPGSDDQYAWLPEGILEVNGGDNFFPEATLNPLDDSTGTQPYYGGFDDSFYGTQVSPDGLGADASDELDTILSARVLALGSTSGGFGGDGGGDEPSPVAVASESGPNKFPCGFAGCPNTFTRAADEARHYRMLHFRESNQPLLCDYPRCSRHKKPLYRQDHFRDHLRDYHKEDLPRRGQVEDAEWWARRSTYAVYDGWWRCNKCFGRVEVEVHGYACPGCHSGCEEDRRAVRQLPAVCGHAGCENRQFFKADVLREHLRDFHGEDLASPQRDHRGKVRFPELDSPAWWQSRKLYQGRWRCNRCMASVDVEETGWTCPRCSNECEAPRVQARKNGAVCLGAWTVPVELRAAPSIPTVSF